MIDDGVDFSHPDLAARAWTNPGESGGGKETNGIDDDGNGYIDDVHGWDFCHDDNTVHDFDDDFHGTHVAGTIAASLDGQGVVGVAPSVKIMALKFIGDDDACGFDSQAIEAIAYAKSFGVHIANNSWGGRGQPKQRAPTCTPPSRIRGCCSWPRPATTASTTTRTLPGPARVVRPAEHHLGRRDRQQRAASPTSRTTARRPVDIAAPGVAHPEHACRPTTGYPDPGWDWLDGTSMAAPHVTRRGGAGRLVPRRRSRPTRSRCEARVLGTGKADAATTGA